MKLISTVSPLKTFGQVNWRVQSSIFRKGLLWVMNGNSRSNSRKCFKPTKNRTDLEIRFIEDSDYLARVLEDNDFKS